jgi:hypothetical protein
MAFKTETPATNGIPDNKKAVGFLNFYLPGKVAGSRKKVGSIPLRKMYANEASLAAWLAEDPVARVAILKDMLQIEYNENVPDNEQGFDLPV